MTIVNSEVAQLAKLPRAIHTEAIDDDIALTALISLHRVDGDFLQSFYLQFGYLLPDQRNLTAIWCDYRNIIKGENFSPFIHFNESDNSIISFLNTVRINPRISSDFRIFISNDSSLL